MQFPPVYGHVTETYHGVVCSLIFVWWYEATMYNGLVVFQNMELTTIFKLEGESKKKTEKAGR
jgi:hypothetical protein